MTKLYSPQLLQSRHIIKIVFVSLSIMLLVTTGLSDASAQTYCSGGSTQGFLSFNCNSSTSTTVNQGDYYRFTIYSGISYNFSSSMPFNPSIYAKQTNSSGSNVFYANSSTGTTESIDWTANFSGTLAVATRYYYCTTWLSGSTYSPVLSYKQNTTINNTTSTASICDDATKSLTYTLGGSGTSNNPTVSWSKVSGSGSGTFSGNTFTATSPGSITIRGTVGVCYDDVTFTILAKSSGPSSLSASSTTVCPGDNVTLTANSGSLGAGAQYRWYTGGSCSGSPFQITSGNQVSVNPTSTTTYSVQIVGDCNTTTCRSVTVNVKTNSSGPSNITKSTDNICPGASVTLTAQGGSLGTGAKYYWYNGGSCGGTAFAVTSGSSTTVAPTSTSTYSCKIIGDCNSTSCVNITVNVTQTNSSGPSSLTSSSNPICSGTNITLTAVSGSLGTGASYQWFSNIGCSGSPFTTTGTNTLSQSPTGTTQYSVRIAGTCNTTPCQATTVTVTPNVGTPTAPSGATQRCAGAGNNTYTSSASNASSYSWSLLPVTAGSINSSGTVTWNSSFVGTATVTVTASGCGSNQSSSTSVEVYQIPNANAGSGGNECDLSVSLQAFPTVGNGTWTQQSGTGTTNFSNANNAATTATVTAYGTYVFRWTEVNGVCSDYDQVTVNFYQEPNANAGGDATTCGFTYGLNATASVGTGTWTKVFGAGTVNFSNANSPSSNVTVPQAGLYVFRWTEVNGTCSDFDEVDITFVAQPVANAGSGGNECDLNFTFNAVASVGTGTWTKTSGPGTANFNNANSTTATVNVSAYGTYVFRWTEVNGSCTDFEEVTVNFYLQPVAVPGSGGSQCDLDFTFSGSTPNAGTGTWSQVSGTGTSTYSNANSPTSSVTATAYGTYVYKWKVVNGTCSDSANVTVNYYEQPVADAGTIGLECDLNHQFDADPSVGTGTWTQAGGAGITTGYAPNASAPNATATVSTYGTYFYTWTEVNGICSSSETVQVLYNQVPTATISVAGEDTICLGDSTLISIDLTGSSPWSVTYTDGSTSTTINNITTSPYSFYTPDDATYTVTNVTDVYNCVGTFSGAADVFVNALPVQPTITNLSGLNGFCQGLFTNLSSSSDAGYVSYLWSPNGGTTQVIAANVAGDYVVTVTDTNDCKISSDTLNIVVYPNPVPVITPDGPTTICQGEDVVLTSSAASSYLWSPGGQTTQSITVTTSGNYTVHVVDANGCEGTSTITQVTVNPLPTATITPFGGSSNGSTSFCQGQNVLLLSSSGASYLWSPGGQTSQIISVNSTSTHQVTVTDGNNCSKTSSPISISVNSNPTPTITSSGATTFCTGGSVTLTASSGNNYLWSNGATTQSITVNTSGSYTVTVGDGNGCNGTSAPTVVTVNSNPTPTIVASGATTFCAGGSVTLTASAGASYLWSSGATTQAINVTSSGAFTVTVTDANGCIGTSATTNVTVNPNPTPTVNAGGPTTFCAGGSVTLTSSASSGNVWSTGLVGQSITVTQSGNYYTTVTNGNGCVGNSDTVTVTVNPNPVVTITPGGPTNFCNGSNVTLTASSGATYLWSAGGQTTQSITASTSGTYSVTVTDANGCTGTASQSVTVYNNPSPTISPLGPTTFCQGGSVQLVSSASSSYLWSPGSQTSQIITVNASGSYSVTVTDANGCSGTSPAETVTVNSISTPTISAGGPTTFCAGGSVTLTASSGNSYLWSNGATTQSINVTSDGSYTVAVTDANGCTGTSAATVVTVNANPTPNINASGPTTFCDGGSVTLTASSAVTYAWSNGVTGQSFSTDTSGTYTVTVTDANGCVGTSPTTTVTVNPNPVATITPGGPTTFCQGGSVTLTSSSSTGNVWSTGVVSQSINVTQSGNYTVQVTNGFGCSTTSSPTTVTVNPNPTPVITSTGLNGLCDGDTILLTTNYLGAGHVWSPGGSTNDTLVVTVSGTYSVTYTDANGCSGTSSSITVNIGSLPQPVITALGPTTFCAGGSVTLFSSSNTGNLWSNGATTQFITVNTPGDYTVTVTDGGGCVGTSDTTTITVNPNPNPTITPNGPTSFCQGDSVTLTANSAAFYLWSNGASTQSINVNASGTFTVSMQDANGCVGTSSATTVTVNPLPTPTISANGPTTFCAGDNVTLTASSAASYLWSNGVTTQSFSTDTSGAYSVMVTDVNGCQATSSTTTVTVNPNPTPVITPSGPTTFCSGGSVVLTSSSSTGNIWSTGVVSQSITVTAAGDYWVTVTDGNGCITTSDTTSVTINNNPTPTISASGPTTFCNGNSVTLTASSGANYLWSSGDTTQSINVTSSGSFSVFVSDGNGCSGTSATTVVTVNPNPTPTVTPLGPTTFCQGQSVQLLSSASANYLWAPGGATSQIMAATATGSYSVTVTDANGCSGTSSPIAVTVNSLPTVSFTGLNPRYCLDAPAATLVGSPLGGSFSLPALGNTFNPGNAGEGTYNVTYTYTNGNGCTNSATQQVIVDSIPDVSFTGLAAEYCVDADIDTLYGTPVGGTFSGPGMSGSTFNPSLATVGTHNITYYFVDGFGCDDSQTQTVVVNPLPTLSIASIENPYCEDASLDSLIGVPAGGTFTGTGIFGDFFDAIDAGVGSHTITYSYTDANGCFNTVDSMLEVVPLPTVSFSGLAAEYCIDATAVTLTGSPVGGAFSGPGTSGNSFDPNAAGLGTHMITYTYTDANGCTNSFSVTTDVVGLPTVSFSGLNAAYCVDEPTDTLIGSPVGGIFSGPGIFGNIFNPGSAGQGTHTITYTYTDASGCVNFSTQQVTVNPLPVISFSGLASRYCINGTPSLLVSSPVGGAFTGNGLLSGNTFDPAFAGLGNHSITFTYTNSNGCTNTLTQQTQVVPLPVVSFTGLDPEYCINDPSTVLIGSPVGGVFTGPGIVSNTNTFSPFLAGQGTHTIVYHYTDTNGCQNSTSQTVTINSLPNVSFFDLDPEYCLNGPFEHLTGVPAGGVFSGNGMNGSDFEPQNATVGTHTITYTYTDTNGCTDNYSQNVVVHPLPQLSFTGLGSEYCVDAAPVTLVATPFGGVFSGDGVVGDQFTPADAGVGVHSITYTYTDANGCIGIDVQGVTVLSTPNVSFTGLDPAYCIDAGPVNLTGIPSGGTFSGDGILGNVFDPLRADVGTHVITYSFTNVNGCDDVFTDTVVVYGLPELSVSGLGGPYCIDDNNGVTLTGTPLGGIFTGDGMSGDIFTPNTAGVGTHFITYDYVDTNGCANSITTSAVVTPLPTVSYSGLASSYCVSDSTPVILTGSPVGGTFSGSGVFGNTFVPSAAGAGIHAVVYNYTDINGCSSASTQAVIVNDLPVVSFSGLAAHYCIENPPVTLVGSPTGGTFSGPGISGSSFNPATAGIGFHTITYHYTDNNGCSNTATQTVEVLQLAPPVITTNGPTTFCQGNTLTLNAGNNYASYAWSDGVTITPTLVADHSATYAVTVTDNNGCSATSNVITVTTTPLPVVSLGPDFSICPNENVTLSPSGTFNSYFWSTGESSSSINISSDNTYWVEVSNTNGCINRDSVVVTLYNPIVPVIQANGSSTICEGNQVTLDAGPNFSSYSWSDNVTTTQTLDAADDGAYLVTTVDSNGCEATSAPFVVNVQNLPGVPLYTNGPLSLCQGQTINISTNAGFMDYDWSNGGSNQSITVGVSGQYSVTVTDHNGCVNNSITLNVAVHQNPSPIVSIVEGSTEFCKGQDTLVLDAGANYQSYNWNTGDTTRYITVTNSGTYGVEVRDFNGCGAGINSPFIDVTVHNPQVPVISVFPGDTLRSSAAVSYQWYHNDTIVSGATSQIYVATQSGTYTVETVDENGCVASSVIEYSPVGVIEASNDQYLSLYPNPGNGKFILSGEFENSDAIEISISNLLGQGVMPVVKLGEANSINKEFDLSGMPKGVYIVEVKFGNERYISRYIKD